MITNSQLSTIELKKQKQSKQLEQEQNHRNGDHMAGYQWGRGGEEWGKRYREEEAKLVGIKQMGRGKKWYRNQRIQRTYKYNPGT